MKEKTLKMEALKGELRIAKQNLMGLKGKVVTNKDEGKNVKDGGLKGRTKNYKVRFNRSSKKREKLMEKIQQLKEKVTTNKNESKEQEKTIRLIMETLKKLQHKNKATEAKNQMVI